MTGSNNCLIWQPWWKYFLHISIGAEKSILIISATKININDSMAAYLCLDLMRECLKCEDEAIFIQSCIGALDLLKMCYIAWKRPKCPWFWSKCENVEKSIKCVYLLENALKCSKYAQNTLIWPHLRGYFGLFMDDTPSNRNKMDFYISDDISIDFDIFEGIILDLNQNNG